ncbi:GGDEF domain-containing protein [bacterium]|nr:MAG: GGDEF domain-containing protein [bacterium]
MQETFYRELLDNLYDGVYFVDLDRRISYWNKGAEQLTGYTSEEVLGRHCWDDFLKHLDDRGELMCESGCPLLDTLNDGKVRDTNVYLLHKEGHRVPVLVRMAPIHGPEEKIIGAVEIFSDNSSRVASEMKIEELEKLALLDELTKIGNRRFMEMSLRTKMDEMIRYRTQLGVFFVDIDNFKQINDSHGHPTGDEILRSVARTLSGALRPLDILCRWGGEEFVVAVGNLDRDILGVIAERFRSLVENSNVVSDKTRIKFTVSVGATIALEGDSLDSVIKRADQLMYQSKEKGRNRVTIDEN